MNRVAVLLSVGGCLMALSFFAGVYTACTFHNNAIAEFYKKAEQEKAVAVQNVIEKERTVNQRITKAFAEQVKENDEIQKRFDVLSGQLDAERLRNSNPTDGNSLSDSAAVTRGSESTCKCRCDGKDFRAVKADLLGLAKEHDLLASKYNRLLEIHKALHEGLKDGSRAESK